MTYNRLKFELEEAIDYQRMLIQEMVVNYLKNNDYVAAENVLRDMYELDDRSINVEHHNQERSGLVVAIVTCQDFHTKPR